MRSLAVLASLLLCACGGVGGNLNEGSVRAAFNEPARSDTALQRTIYDPTTDQTGVLTDQDLVMMTLVSGYICDFRENALGLNALATTNRGSESCPDGAGRLLYDDAGVQTRGEIAITASYQVRGADNQESQPRVIFFSDDVRETGQLLNFVNLPIYGPAPVANASSILKLEIYELDVEEAQETAALLKKIATLGGQVGSPVFGTAFQALLSVGQVFATANEDDREFSFTIGFDPSGAATSTVARNRLREGYYAFIRRERRDSTNHFSGLVICKDPDFIAESSDDCASGKYYRGSTWLLMRVSQEDAKTVQAILAGQLRDQLFDAKPDPEPADLGAINDYLNRILPGN